MANLSTRSRRRLARGVSIRHTLCCCALVNSQPSCPLNFTNHSSSLAILQHIGMETGDEVEKFVDAFDEHCTPSSLVLQNYPSQD